MPKNHFVMIKTTLDEKENLKRIARAEGCATLTDFCRQRLFQSLHRAGSDTLAFKPGRRAHKI